jgi:hypothetical protein
MARSPLYREILEYIPFAPDTAKIPVPVAAIHEGISRDEIRKRYPTVKIGKRREAVLLGHLRGKREVVTA